MNIHHLELFYYVAKHGGIMPAVRNIPYGIQQPAVSAQVAQLEEHLGVTLFQRRPFSLTRQGTELYEFIRPFFENLTPMAEKLRGGIAQHLTTRPFRAMGISAAVAVPAAFAASMSFWIFAAILSQSFPATSGSCPTPFAAPSFWPMA